MFAAVSKKSCGFCGKPGAVNRCAACKIIVYCNKSCQKRHWKAQHKIECVYANKEKNLRPVRLGSGKKIKTASDRYNHVLPLSIYNYRQFVDYVMQKNKEVHRPLMKIIFEYLTGFFMEYEFEFEFEFECDDHKHSNMSTTARSTTTTCVDVYRDHHVLIPLIEMISPLSSYSSSCSAFAAKYSSFACIPRNVWIEWRVMDLIHECILFDISIVRFEQNGNAGEDDGKDEGGSANEQCYTDTVDIVATFMGGSTQYIPLNVASALSSSCIPTFGGKEYALLLKMVLDHYQFPYSKIRTFGLSWSITANKAVRSAYLECIRTFVAPQYGRPARHFFDKRRQTNPGPALAQMQEMLESQDTRW